MNQLAINGGKPVRTKPYPAWPVFSEEDINAVAQVLKSGQLTTLTGKVVAQFEQEFTKACGAPHVVATSSGTTAIHLALAALGIGPGDEVIVPGHTFIASATPVLHQNAVPVFADVDDRTYTLDPRSVAERITACTKAIIAVHLNGHPADLDALLALAQPQGIALIEDAAQAHGARYKDRVVGSVGTIGCFSFWEDKILTTGGEGGAAVTSDPKLAELMRSIRSHGEGQIQGERAYYHLRLGYNYRLSELHAATGLVQLRRLDEYLRRRRENAAYLTQQLEGIDGVTPPFVHPEVEHSFYKFICRLETEQVGVDVATLVKAVAAEGVPISRRYPTPLPLQPLFQEQQGYGSVHCPTQCPHYQGQVRYGAGVCPTAERLAGQLFTLLVHPTAQQSDLDDVAAAVAKVATHYRRR